MGSFFDYSLNLLAPAALRGNPPQLSHLLPPVPQPSAPSASRAGAEQSEDRRCEKAQAVLEPAKSASQVTEDDNPIVIERLTLGTREKLGVAVRTSFDWIRDQNHCVALVQRL